MMEKLMIKEIWQILTNFHDAASMSLVYCTCSNILIDIEIWEQYVLHLSFFSLCYDEKPLNTEPLRMTSQDV